LQLIWLKSEDQFVNFFLISQIGARILQTMNNCYGLQIYKKKIWYYWTIDFLYNMLAI